MAFNWSRLACSEMPDRSFYSVARAVTFHRIDRVVTIHAHAEYRFAMTLAMQSTQLAACNRLNECRGKISEMAADEL